VADLEQILEEKTYKNQVETVSRRVFYTLTHEVNVVAMDVVTYQSAKLLSLLVDSLSKKGAVSQTELDHMLLEAIR